MYNREQLDCPDVQVDNAPGKIRLLRIDREAENNRVGNHANAVMQSYGWKCGAAGAARTRAACAR